MIQAVFPYLRVRNANAAIEFYKHVFGAIEGLRLTEPSGRIGHAELKYAGPKGILQFPLDEPIPYALIKRIVKLRVKQDNVNHEAKLAKRRK